MPTRVADTIKQQNDLKTFPVAYSEDIWIDKNKGEGEKDYADLQELYNEGALGGSGLPTPESKDKMLVSTENEETSELEWSQVDKGIIDGSAYVNLDTGSDLNTLVTHGRYRTTTKRIDRIANLPVQVAGMLTVRLTGSVIYQTYNSIDNKMYTRTSEDSGENWSDWKDVSVGDSSFKGTHDEWDALSDEEKAMFETVIFTDDYGEGVIDDTKPNSTVTTLSAKKINDSLVDKADKSYVDDNFATMDDIGLKTNSLIIKADTSEGTFKTYNSRKFSDYRVLLFTIGSSIDVRDSIVISTDTFASGAKVISTIMHNVSSSKASDYSVSVMTITYVNDTTYSITLGGTKAVKSIECVGLA